MMALNWTEAKMKKLYMLQEEEEEEEKDRDG